jgi:hypothetical protein
MEGADWMHLPGDTDKRNTPVNLRITYNAREFDYLGHCNRLKQDCCMQRLTELICYTDNKIKQAIHAAAPITSMSNLDGIKHLVSFLTSFCPL